MFICRRYKNNVVVNVLNIVAKEHDKWVRIAKSFGLDVTAEDLVQEMYLKIHAWKGKYDKTLMYNDTEVNHYFVFKVLRSLFLDKKKRKTYEYRFTETTTEPSTFSSTYEYNEQLSLLKEEIKNWHLYDRKIYELIFIEGYSMLELSKQTGIDYYSIYRTKNKIERLLYEKMQE